MTDETTAPAQGPLHTLLGQVGARNLRDVAERPLDDIYTALDRMTIPPSKALLGALVLAAVHDLRAATHQMRDATERLDAGTGQLLSLTKWLVLLAALTLAAAVVMLVVAG